LAEIFEELDNILIIDLIEVHINYFASFLVGSDSHAIIIGDMYLFRLRVVIKVKSHIYRLLFNQSFIILIYMDILSKQEKVEKIKEYFSNMRMDSSVMNKTVGIPSTNITPNILIQTTAKLLKVYSREIPQDDRDNLSFSNFLGAEDYIKEHIEYDAGRIQQKAKMKLRQKRNLSWLHSGFFTPQIKSVFVGNALSQNIEGVNPMEQYMLAHKVTKMGEGGIGSTDSIPDSSRSVNESQFGLMDPIQTVEATTIGVVNFFVKNTRKGEDGKLYRLVEDPTGKKVWIDHQTLLESVVEIPEA
jgi:DNA-directed RNA polymerase beta subunit